VLDLSMKLRFKFQLMSRREKSHFVLPTTYSQTYGAPSPAEFK